MVGAASIPAVWYVMGLVLWALSLGCEVNHSHPCNTEVKNAWSYTSISLYILMLSCLVEQRDNITFTWSQYVYFAMEIGNSWKRNCC